MPPTGSNAPTFNDLPGPQRPAKGEGNNKRGGDGDAEDEEDSEDDEEAEVDEYDDFLPEANEVALQGHKKIVSALAMEHTGSRLITGSHDYSVKIYDFNGMKRDMKPFRELVPNDGADNASKHHRNPTP